MLIANVLALLFQSRYVVTANEAVLYQESHNSKQPHSETHAGNAAPGRVVCSHNLTENIFFIRRNFRDLDEDAEELGFEYAARWAVIGHPARSQILEVVFRSSGVRRLVMVVAPMEVVWLRRIIANPHNNVEPIDWESHENFLLSLLYGQSPVSGA